MLLRALRVMLSRAKSSKPNPVGNLKKSYVGVKSPSQLKPFRYQGWITRLKGEIRQNNPKNALTSFRQVQTSTLADDVKKDLYQSLIFMFHRLKQPRKAIQFFDEMRTQLVPDTRLCTTMLSVYGKLGEFDQVSSLFEEMKAKSIQLDRFVFNTLISIQVNNDRGALVTDYLQQMSDLNLTPDIVTFTILIHYAAKKKQPEQAMEIFNELKLRKIELTAAPYNRLLAMFRDLEEIHSFLDICETMKQDKVAPDRITYNIMIHKDAQARNPVRAEQRFNEMYLANIPPDRFTYNTMITMYGKLKNTDRAESLFAQMRNKRIWPDLVTFNTRLAMYASLMDWKQVDLVHQEMKEFDIIPDRNTEAILRTRQAQNSTRGKLEGSKGQNLKSLHAFEKMLDAMLKSLEPR